MMMTCATLLFAQEQIAFDGYNHTTVVDGVSKINPNTPYYQSHIVVSQGVMYLDGIRIPIDIQRKTDEFVYFEGMYYDDRIAFMLFKDLTFVIGLPDKGISMWYTVIPESVVISE